jgi:hypothetical protein
MSPLAQADSHKPTEYTAGHHGELRRKGEKLHTKGDVHVPEPALQPHRAYHPAVSVGMMLHTRQRAPVPSIQARAGGLMLELNVNGLVVGFRYRVVTSVVAGEQHQDFFDIGVHLQDFETTFTVPASEGHAPGELAGF